MQGDHDELEIFLEIHLIAFTNRSKFKFQRRENTCFLKRKLGLTSWVMERVVSADLQRRGCDSVGMDRGFNVATDWPGISSFVGLTLLQNEATIGPRS